MKNLVLGFMVLALSVTASADLIEVIESLEEVQIIELENGDSILGGPAGLSLYTFDVDDEGVSNCFGSCLVTWPALLTQKDELPSPFSVHVRPDGAKQVVLDGEPLYYFISDKKVGEMKGDNLGGVWHIINL